MTTSADRKLGEAAVSVGWVAGPLAVSLLVAVLLALGGSEAEDAAGAASSVWHSFFWPVCLGTLVACIGLVSHRRAHPVMPAGAIEEIFRAAANADDEALRALGEQVNVDAAGLEQVLVELKESRERVREDRDLLEALILTLSTLKEGMQGESSSVREVNRAVEETLTFHQTLTQHIDSLSHSAEQSSSSVLEMVAINNEVRENIHNLSLSVSETTTAIEEMAVSSREVAKNVEELSTAAEETAASMNEMDVSISQVETNANETSKLSETVSGDAETGVAALKQTIGGIDKIKESSRVGAEVIGNLGQKISEIGNILNVIDDVAEQTNLLALNAAIIAAQAGEHGRGFAVVADEIKALAERTGASTKEIADLVKTIQTQSRNAIDVMSKGVEDVEEGVRLGHNAEDALRKIVESAKRSTLMIQAIAHATVEQAKGSRQVANAISRIAETVQQISFATAEQAKGSEHIMKSAERMRVITQQVERSADEQNRGGRQITQAVENIRDMVEGMSRAQREQSSDIDRMAAAATKIKRASEESLHACGDLESQLRDALERR